MSPTNKKDVARELEGIVLRQLLSEAKAFRGQGAGAHVYSDMFVDALAKAIGKGGGLGLASVIERSLGPEAPGGSSPAPVAAAAAEHGGARAVDRLLERSHDTLAEMIVGRGGRESSRFGARVDPLDHTLKFHGGIDIAARAGAPIRVAKDGVVTFAGERGGYGLVVEVDHGDGLVTRYAHAQHLHVRAGERVTGGQQVADVGSTGRSTGPHVHVEAIRGGRRVDPQASLSSHAEGVDPSIEVLPARKP